MVAKILQGFSDCNYLGCKNIFSFYRPMKKTEVQLKHTHNAEMSSGFQIWCRAKGQ